MKYSGQVYQGSGVTRFHFVTDGKRPFQYSFLNVFHLVGRGNTPNFWAFDKYYLTLDEDGTVIGVFLDQLSITCR